MVLRVLVLMVPASRVQGVVRAIRILTSRFGSCCNNRKVGSGTRVAVEKV